MLFKLLISYILIIGPISLTVYLLSEDRDGEFYGHDIEEIHQYACAGMISCAGLVILGMISLLLYIIWGF